MVVLLGACGASASLQSTAMTQKTNIAATCQNQSDKGPLTVFATSSMTNVLTEIKEKYLSEHPCVSDLTFSFGSSSMLGSQIKAGAPADVFIAASEETMQLVVGLQVGDIPMFARNGAEIMLFKDGQFIGKIDDLRDLMDVNNPGIKVGLCVSTAPCGAIADDVLFAQNLSREAIVDTEATSVQDLVTKIQLGELDAGIVFKSDCVYALRHQTARCVGISQTKDFSISSPYFSVQFNSNKNTTDWASFISSNSTKKMLQVSYGFLAP